MHESAWSSNDEDLPFLMGNAASLPVPAQKQIPQADHRHADANLRNQVAHP